MENHTLDDQVREDDRKTIYERYTNFIEYIIYYVVSASACLIITKLKKYFQVKKNIFIK
jgi:hypothetical protein